MSNAAAGALLLGGGELYITLKLLLAPSTAAASHPLVHRPFKGGLLCFASIAGKWKFCGFYFYDSVQEIFLCQKAQIA